MVLEQAMPVENGWHAKQNPAMECFFFDATRNNKSFFDVRTHETLHSNVWVCIGIGGFKGNLILQTWLASDKEGRGALQKDGKAIFRNALERIDVSLPRLWERSDRRGGRLFLFRLPLNSPLNLDEELKPKDWYSRSFAVNFEKTKEAIESLLVYLKKELHLLPEDLHQGVVFETRSVL